MLNQAIIIGRLKEIKDDIFILAVTNSFKNEKGEYDTELFKVKVNLNYPDDLINVGNILGIKGRNGIVDGEQIIIAEKITFLSGGKTNETE